MLTLEEFKKRYEKELVLMTQEEVEYYYSLYTQDPFEFNADMIG